MWTIEKVYQHIKDKVEENLYLDYKAADSLANSDGKKNEIAKDVSAFANSDGGTILYGVKEFNEGPKFLPEEIDPIDRDQFSKETLEQIINSRISPRIQGIIITPIQVSEDEINQVLYAVDIPKSDTAHQSSDKRYYRRYNFQSIPMDDWEVKDIINRKNKSLISISFKPRFEKSTFETYMRLPGAKMPFDIIATNVGNNVVQYCDCIIKGRKTTAGVINPRPDVVKGTEYFELYYTNEIEYKIPLEDKEFVVNQQRIPILPKTYRKIGEIEFYSEFFIDDYELAITISMDDNRITSKKRGRNLIE